MVDISIVNILEIMTGNTLLLLSNRKSCIGFLLAYLHFPLAHFKVKVTVMHISSMNILKMMKDRENITIAVK